MTFDFQLATPEKVAGAEEAQLQAQAGRPDRRVADARQGALGEHPRCSHRMGDQVRVAPEDRAVDLPTAYRAGK